MPKTESLVTSVDSAVWNEFMTDNGVVKRIRDGEVAVLTGFSSLSIPNNATIDGIIVHMKGAAAETDHDTRVGGWVQVSKDGGVSYSTVQSVTTEPWVAFTGSQTNQEESAGGTTFLWGKTWNVTTALGIVVKLAWSTTNTDAAYLDFVKIEIHYTPATYYSEDGETEFIISNGDIVIPNGEIEIK